MKQSKLQIHSKVESCFIKRSCATLLTGLMGLFLCAKREPLGEKLRLRMGYDIPHPIPPVIGAVPGDFGACLQLQLHV